VKCVAVSKQWVTAGEDCRCNVAVVLLNFNDLGHRIQAVCQKRVIMFLMQRLSVAIQRGNAACIIFYALFISVVDMIDLLFSRKRAIRSTTRS